MINILLKNQGWRVSKKIKEIRIEKKERGG
jgi:type I site-specific restriction endonuclease